MPRNGRVVKLTLDRFSMCILHITGRQRKQICAGVTASLLRDMAAGEQCRCRLKTAYHPPWFIPPPSPPLLESRGQSLHAFTKVW